MLTGQHFNTGGVILSLHSLFYRVAPAVGNCDSFDKGYEMYFIKSIY